MKWFKRCKKAMKHSNSAGRSRLLASWLEQVSTSGPATSSLQVTAFGLRRKPPLNKN